jgi:hypothetical protein
MQNYINVSVFACTQREENNRVASVLEHSTQQREGLESCTSLLTEHKQNQVQPHIHMEQTESVHEVPPTEESPLLKTPPVQDEERIETQEEGESVEKYDGADVVDAHNTNNINHSDPETPHNLEDSPASHTESGEASEDEHVVATSSSGEETPVDLNLNEHSSDQHHTTSKSKHKHVQLQGIADDGTSMKVTQYTFFLTFSLPCMRRLHNTMGGGFFFLILYTKYLNLK